MLPPPSYLVKRTPANIVRAYKNDLPETGHAPNEPRTKPSKPKYKKQNSQPFSAKVKRRWSDTKSKVKRRLGMYTFLEPMPLGLYLDMVI
jgi:hypothetical protein